MAKPVFTLTCTLLIAMSAALATLAAVTLLGDHDDLAAQPPYSSSLSATAIP